MAMPVVNGAMCSCTFGVAPCPLMATSQQQALAVNMPVATISDVHPWQIQRSPVQRRPHWAF